MTEVKQLGGRDVNFKKEIGIFYRIYKNHAVNKNQHLRKFPVPESLRQSAGLSMKYWHRRDWILFFICWIVVVFQPQHLHKKRFLQKKSICHQFLYSSKKIVLYKRKTYLLVFYDGFIVNFMETSWTCELEIHIKRLRDDSVCYSPF